MLIKTKFGHTVWRAEFFNADGSGILGQGLGASIKSGSKYGREGRFGFNKSQISSSWLDS